MSAEIVIRQLESYSGNVFKWIAAGSGGFYHWVTSSNDKNKPENYQLCGLCCFYLPLVAALETGCIDKNRASDLIYDQMKSGIENKEPNQWSRAIRTTGGWFSCFSCFGGGNYPNRGDVVFFSGTGAKYFAHVAVATGDQDEVISFGHDAPYLQGGLHDRQVALMSIAEVKRTNPLLTEVHFGSPTW